MFTMAKIKDRNTANGLSHKSNYLDSHLIHNDYYCEGNKVSGKWTGKLSEVLGLKNKEIKEGDKAFESLRKNINPLTEEKLTPRNREGGIRYFDFQCSAQKSVSIMAITLGDERLRKAHIDSFSFAIKELERFAARRDNSNHGTILEPTTTGNILAGVFHHDASRSLDPQLHTHCTVVNATHDEKTDKILALESTNMVKAIRYAGKVYQNELAKKVRELGYQIETKINKKGVVEGFEIKGVSENIQKMFSKRRSVIETEMEKFREIYGRKPTTEEIHVITKESRNKKLAEITTEEVVQGQRKQLTDYELGKLTKLKDNAIEISNSKNGIEMLYGDKMDETINYSIGHLYARSSVLKGNQVLAESLNQGLGYIYLDHLKEQIKLNPELVTLKENPRNSYLGDDITTVTGMNLELWASEKVMQTKNSTKPLNKRFAPFSDRISLQEEANGNKNYKEQRAAIKGILKSGDQFISLRGVAGSGKTTSLRELQKGLNGKVKNVVYLAPTTGARDVLKKEGFDNAATIESFKMQHENILTKKGLIIVDEAGFLSNIDGTEIMKIAIKNKAKVLFVGDTKQHKSVAAGDFLRMLEEYPKIQKVELNEIFRQKNTYYNRAAAMLASGDIEDGIHLMDTHESMQWVKEGKGKYIDNAINDYLNFTEGGKHMESCIFITPTHNEADNITLKLRDKLKGNGIIDSTSTQTKEIFKSENWTASQKKSAKNYVTGQKILITRDSENFRRNELLTVQDVAKNGQNRNRVRLTDGRILTISKYKNFEVGESKDIELCRGEKVMARMPFKDIANGDVFTVTGMDKHGNVTTKEGTVIPAQYKSLQYGYVSTSHKKQGSKADYVVIAAETINRDAIYVASTRGVHECRLNVPDKGQLYRQANILTERRGALDVISKNKKNTSLVDQALQKHGLSGNDIFNPQKARTNVEKRIQKRDTARVARKFTAREKVWDQIKRTTHKALKMGLLDYIKSYKSLQQDRLNQNKYKINDPFEELARQQPVKSKTHTKDFSIGIDF